jgi:hypothetical protein
LIVKESFILATQQIKKGDEMYDEAKRLAQKVNEFKASLVKLMKL